MEEPVVNLKGQHVALGPLRRDLIPLYQRWNNDFAITRTLASSGPVALEYEELRYEQSIKAEAGTFFTIYEVCSWRPIGTTYLYRIDYRHRTAEFGIAIGEVDCHGKGYGTETTSLLLSYAFDLLGLHSVYLKVYANNMAGIRAYEKAGFKVFGRQRQCHQVGGQLWDVIHMECLAPELPGRYQTS